MGLVGMKAKRIVRFALASLIFGWLVWHSLLRSTGVAVILPVRSIDKPNTGTTAAELLEEAKSKYRECKYYSDHGWVVTVFDGEARRPAEERFATSYRRPDRFRFECTDVFQGDALGSESVIQVGDTVRTFVNVTHELGVGLNRSLEEGLMELRGVSKSSSTHVPCLLLGLRPGTVSPLEIKDARYEGNVQIGEEVCREIRGQWGDEVVAIFLSLQSGMIRRIHSAT